MKYLEILFRIITILPMFLVITLLTGRRKIGELPVFDFLSLLAVGAVVGADIADPDIEHWPTAYAVILIMLLHYIYSIVLVKSKRVGKLLTFEPVVVIENGQFVKGNMKKLKYSIDNILTLLRDKDVFDLNEVEFAIIESTGQLSVLKKSQYQPITPSEIKINTDYVGLSIPLIVEGTIYKENLERLNLDEKWLSSQLKTNNVASEKDVFYAAFNTKGELYISVGKEKSSSLHDLRH
ncbi:DUF421 domain-containing protein [Lacrimispora saccharolytica]|uniref:DUF421 domain-containing protein n=1 Tax=Lacrimispora saccharolytica (strain ATCC 35040 / DSM 2544 / NRCC 2533 / WM1) TaxID=610130 RepID=D9R0K4_LACSW|nr:DUF421 domain-containing protein [Lacrimispora saccharolytica]ADL06437.1 protein of unknown function DUF421 [[Clostridium] saccharolyticum WM1]QRV19476.1 DUF421 domain-containing protein [Lacrimispora saccharolytica]